jgi:DNA-binding transcriptional LysR family regulator
MARADHPFAAGGAIGLRDALTQPLCLSDDIAEGLQLVLRGGRRKADPAVPGGLVSPTHSPTPSGLWCALVPESFADLLARRDEIRLCPLSGAPSWQPGVVLARRELQSPMVRAFEACVRALQAEGWATPREGPQTDPVDDPGCSAAIPPRCGL